ncbi:MAG: OmpA family protein [Thermostichales cyanobacterium BF4_bins_65]
MRGLGVIVVLALLLSGCEWLSPQPAPEPTPWSDPKVLADIDRLNQELARLQGRVSDLEADLATLQTTLEELQRPTPIPLPVLTPTPAPSPTPSPTTLDVGSETISLPGDVLFDFDRADLRPEATALLQQVAATLRQRPGSRVMIIGHTDNIGEERYNLELSLRRATAVKEFLQGQVDAELKHRWNASGYGASQPVADNNTAAGRQRNRRVDIVIAP